MNELLPAAEGVGVVKRDHSHRVGLFSHRNPFPPDGAPDGRDPLRLKPGQRIQRDEVLVPRFGVKDDDLVAAHIRQQVFVTERQVLLHLAVDAKGMACGHANAVRAGEEGNGENGKEGNGTEPSMGAPKSRHVTHPDIAASCLCSPHASELLPSWIAEGLS